MFKKTLFRGIFEKIKPQNKAERTDLARLPASVVNQRRQLKLRQLLQQRQTADFYYFIDIVGTCNLRCPSCPVGNYVEQPAKGLMSLETYKSASEKIV